MRSRLFGVLVLVLAALTLLGPAAAQADRAVLATNSDTPTTGLAAFAAPEGQLSMLDGAPVATGNETSAVAISPDARHAYVANTNDDTIGRYSLAANGLPTPLGATPAGGNQPTGLGFSPDGSFLLATNRDSTDADPTVSVFAVDASNGALTAVAGSPFDVGVHDPRAVVVSPDGRFVYVTARRGPTGPPASNADSAIAVLAIGEDGSLTPITGSPFFLVGQVNAFGASIAPDGSRLFMTRSNGNAIHVFDLNATTGAPTQIAGSPFTAGANAPSELTVAPDGGSLYVAEVFGQAVEGFTINPATGALTQIPGTPLSLAPRQSRGVALTPDGENLYVSMLSNPGVVEGLAVGAGGGLTRLTGSPYETEGEFPNFFSVAVTPTQTPEPAFSAPATGKAGEQLDFDASATTVRGGEATRFDWDFGDGTTAADGGSTISHAYTQDGTYTVTLTVTNDCDPAAPAIDGVVSVGNAIYCRGARQAQTTGTVVVDSVVDGEVKAKKTQKQKGKKVVVEAKVIAGEQLDAKLKGKIRISGRRFSLAPKTKSVDAGQTKKFKLKPKKPKHTKKILRALDQGKTGKTRLMAKLTDEVGNKAKSKLKVTLEG